MLLLSFRVGSSQYALPASAVVEVVPRVELLALARSQPFLAGLLNYRGDPVPVLDLGVLLHDRCCTTRMSTRIVLVQIATNHGRLRLGLIAEQVTGTLAREAEDLQATGVTVEATPFVEKITRGEDGSLVQLMNPDRLLSDQVAQQLFGNAPAALSQAVAG